MMYPITPDYLQDAPKELVELYGYLEAEILTYICSQFAQGEANATAVELVRMLQRRGLDLDEIEKRIKKVTGLTDKQLDKILKEAVKRNQGYFGYTLDKMGLVGDKIKMAALQGEIKAIERQTRDELRNITQSMGFAIRNADGTLSFLPIAEAYQKVLDQASIEVWAGAVDYQTSIRNATRKLTDSGLQYIDYASGWHNRVDVAARRAVMTGITQVSAAYSISLKDEIGTDYVEVTAHRGARDKGTGPMNHKSWQGKVYAVGAPSGGYQSLEAVTGYGTGEGLCGWNCRHHFHPFVPGVMERTYTDKQLEELDPPPFEFEGEKYTAYAATQKQRQIETVLRKLERKIIASNAAGDTETLQTASIKYRRLWDEYRSFSEAADLPTQDARVYIQGWGPSAEKYTQKAMNSLITKP